MTKKRVVVRVKPREVEPKPEKKPELKLEEDLELDPVKEPELNSEEDLELESEEEPELKTERKSDIMKKVKTWAYTHRVGLLLTLCVLIFAYFGMNNYALRAENARLMEGNKVVTSDEGINALISDVADLREEVNGIKENQEKLSDEFTDLAKRVDTIEEKQEKLSDEFDDFSDRVNTLESSKTSVTVSTSEEEAKEYTSESYNEPTWVGSDEAPEVTDISAAIEKIETQETEDNASYEAEQEIREENKEEITSDDVVVVPEAPSESTVEETVENDETVVEETTEGEIEISGGEIEETPSDEFDWDSAPVVGVEEDGSMEVVSIELDMAA